MSKIVPVSLLKSGDRFAFVNSPSGGAPSPLNQESKSILVVTRPPSVNLAANTCFFRYQQAATLDTGPNSRESNDSWNGTPDTQVRLVTTDPGGNPPTPAAEAAAGESASDAESAPPAKPAKKQAVKTPKPREAKPETVAPVKAAVEKINGEPTTIVKRAVDTSVPEKSEPRQGVAILPTMTKAVSQPETKKTASKKEVGKEPSLKKTAKRVSPKKAGPKKAKTSARKK